MQCYHTIRFIGNINTSQIFTLTYQVQVAEGTSGSLVNQALVATPPLAPLTLAQSLSVPRDGLAGTKVAKLGRYLSGGVKNRNLFDRIGGIRDAAEGIPLRPAFSRSRRFWISSSAS